MGVNDEQRIADTDRLERDPLQLRRIRQAVEKAARGNLTLLLAQQKQYAAHKGHEEHRLGQRGHAHVNDQPHALQRRHQRLVGRTVEQQAGGRQMSNTRIQVISFVLVAWTAFPSAAVKRCDSRCRA